MLTHAELEAAIASLWQTGARANLVVMHPRDYHAFKRYLRWMELTRAVVWSDPRWPRVIRVRLERRRRAAAERRFAAWLARYPYRPHVWTAR